MEKKKIITIALIGILACVLLFGGITLSNKTNGNTDKENKNKQTESTESTEGTENSESAESTESTESSESTENANTESKSDVATEESKTTTSETTQKTENTQKTETTQKTESTSKDDKPKYTFTDLNKTMYASSAVNVRDLPSTDGKKVGGLSKGQAVTVTGQCKETKWYRISLNGSTAYVSNNYLTDTKPAENKPASSKPSSSNNSSSSNNTSSSNNNPKKNVDRNKFEMVYTNPSIGDGLDEYRNGLHMWTADGKYQLYVPTTYNGYEGFFFLSNDGTMEVLKFSSAYMDSEYCPTGNGSSTDYYTYHIDGVYYHYQFMRHYDPYNPTGELKDAQDILNDYLNNKNNQ